MNSLRLQVGRHTSAGRKEHNQDALGVRLCDEPLLTHKGIALAVADGISSSRVSHVASETAINSLLHDYYYTADAWSVQKAGQRVLQACNAWLHAQTRQGEGRFDRDRGYVCTLSAVIFKSNTAHLFHVGDTRIYRLRGDSLEQLSTDHRVRVDSEQSYLARALGANPQIDIDYQRQPLVVGDLYLLASDGLYEHLAPAQWLDCLRAHPENLDQAAQAAVELALDNGSPDNLTLLLARIDALPPAAAPELREQLAELPAGQPPQAGDCIDGLTLLRQLHGSSRSHVWLARTAEAREVVIKFPSIEGQEHSDYLERLLLEEWIARRIDNPHVLRGVAPPPQRSRLYVLSEYLPGQTLAQWMRDHPQPSVEAVREIIEQVGRGLQAFHRQEMLHQDLRPENILIDRHGTLKIIDFGSVSVAGLNDLHLGKASHSLQGTALYSAPEYFLGAPGSPASDLFTLGVLTYQLLSGRLPYGSAVAKCKSLAAQRRLKYRSVLDAEREIPFWLDATLRKATQVEPHRRYQELSEFLFDLRQPNPSLVRAGQPPLLETHPVRVWQGLSALLALLSLWLAWQWLG